MRRRVASGSRSPSNRLYLTASAAALTVALAHSGAAWAQSADQAPKAEDDTVEAVGTALANDLQPAALAARPDLVGVLELGSSLGALGGIVSGSGPTCVFLTESEAHSLDLAAALRATSDVSAALAVHGPVHGARVIPD